MSSRLNLWQRYLAWRNAPQTRRLPTEEVVAKIDADASAAGQRGLGMGEGWGGSA